MPSRSVIFKGKYRVPGSALHLAGFRRWAHSSKFPRRGKVSYISGEVHLDMSPEEIRSHNSVKGDVFAAIWNFCRSEGIGKPFADRALLINEPADLATEPDVMFCRWETIESGRVQLVEFNPGSGRFNEVHGSPDLVVEIISKSSVKKDKQTLRDAYFRAGIPEYWLIDARGDDLQFSVLRRESTDYVDAACDPDGFLPSSVLNRRVKLTRDIDRIGGWRYPLEFV